MHMKFLSNHRTCSWINAVVALYCDGNGFIQVNSSVKKPRRDKDDFSRTLRAVPRLATATEHSQRLCSKVFLKTIKIFSVC